MNARKHRKYVTRLVWLMNHDEDSEAWCMAASRAGYVVNREDRGRFTEWRLAFDGDTVAFIHEFPDEAFCFVFAFEARAAWVRRVWWRLTHPFTRRPPLPWPRRTEAVPDGH